MNNTITVSGHFGDTQINRADFTTRWTDHIKQLRMISWEQEWQIEVDAITDKVRTTAMNEFDRLFIAQQEAE